MTTAYITHEDCQKHDMGAGHPESPSRLNAIHDQLMQSGVWDFLRHEEAPEVTMEALLRVHPQSYIDAIQKECPRHGQQAVILGPDVVANEFTWQAAMHAAGAGTKAVDLVMAKEVNNAFCAVRPPGHHAEFARAMGFCLFGNVAVAVKHALEAHGLERVAVLDFDVHHGNGTEDLLQHDERVLFCSSYQHPYYPFSVPDNPRDNVVHSPLPAGTSGEEFREIVTDVWLPKLHYFKPQMIFISAGFDAHTADPLADLHFNERDYKWFSQQVKAFADSHCEGRIVSCLEGGYDLTGLARSVMQHIRVLMELD